MVSKQLQKPKPITTKNLDQVVYALLVGLPNLTARQESHLETKLSEIMDLLNKNQTQPAIDLLYKLYQWIDRNQLYEVKLLEQKGGAIEATAAIIGGIAGLIILGGAVLPHQDETYITPIDETCVAFWIALDDATIDNGCLWVIPKSHQAGIGCYSIYDPRIDKMRLTRNGKLSDPTLESKILPDNIGDFVPVEVKKGDLVVFDGRLVHKSEPNTSNKTRHAITFHSVQRGTPLSDRSWLGKFGYWRIPLG